MRFFTALAIAGSVVAQNASQSLCDKYTTALLKDNTPKNQYTLLTLLVNTVVIGNYTQPNKNAVPGILAAGTYNGVAVNLLPYFNGMLASTNDGGKVGVSQNFLDGGGAAPLKMNKPADDTSSNQYFLLTHLYQFFGKLLGCSGYGQMDFPKYGGQGMYEAHAFMNLDPNQLGYFVTQVGLAATSFGVSTDDVTAVAKALNMYFGYRCSPATTVIPEQGPTLNSICINSACPLDPKADCAAYPNNGVALVPQKANSSSMSASMGASSMMPSGTMGSGSMASSTGAAMPPASTGGASVLATGMSLIGAGLALVVFF